MNDYNFILISEATVTLHLTMLLVAMMIPRVLGSFPEPVCEYSSMKISPTISIEIFATFLATQEVETKQKHNSQRSANIRHASHDWW